ncbi:immunoglobulin-like domain-containing protein [Lacinutrix iliipiscaria]|uniref:Immunoglobulin-like domain-containing protein n=1 Tax=Lacinutrix iliipiscaria TaxID=1230532 RepID=A0ABW5WMQ6_9FLAO
MRIKLGLLIFFMSTTLAFSQTNQLWQKQSISKNISIKSNKQNLPQTNIYSLNLDNLKAALANAPARMQNSRPSNVILSFPNSEGKFESFRIIEASVLSPELQARYPDIRSYAGQGIDNPASIIRFSISPLGFQSMVISANQPASFIEVYSDDLSQYVVFKRADKTDFTNDFECSVTETVNRALNTGTGLRNADDSILRTYRLAVSTTGEYTAYHGGTKALALAAINNTMTRVNGIFETDFNVTMELIGNTDDVIYTNSGSDPYGNTTSGYNSALQSTLTSVIGEANYDIGHLFASLQNNGNAGCIGCVCVNNQKGSGWTSATVPDGDFFDVDYVAHEMGHQFGANHTWTFNGNEGTNVQVEPGSGSTIMSYAGITGATDVQANVHPNFHAVSIEQVTDYVKSTSCQTNTNLGNAVPVVNAGPNYTIPKGTAFILEGSATDANPDDVLTYSWEQMDENNASTTYPSTTATTGVAFRAYEPTTDNYRYFPRLETIKTGATSWQWEAVPNVARSLNFRLTARDNRAGGATNSSDDMVVTVNGTAGPFVVNSPNTNVTWNAGTTQTVTWDVAGTTSNGVNAANVDIFLSTDGGDTYPIALASNVANDGSHDIIVPNNQGTQCRIMVRGSNHIFFDISNSNFEIAGTVVCNATTPSGLSASGVGANTATLGWNAVAGASYDLQYREVGAGSWVTIQVNGVSTALSGLSTLTQYEAQVRSACPDNSTSAYSSTINFTTTDVQLNYCASASTNINDEFIGRVQLNTIDNASGGQFYTDFTSISTTLTKDTQYTITVTPTWTGTVYSEGYSVWIDYNRDGDFGDAGEQVWTQSATQSTPVSGSFTIPSSAVENATRMRVSMKYNGIPTSCETFQYGEVEDYTVIIEGSGPDIEAPVITLNGASTLNLNVGETYTELGATATDNIDGNLTSSIVVGGDTVNTSLGGTYVVTYNVSDAAGNAAAEVIRTVNVIPDTTAPVISLIGSSNISLQLGDSYSDQGATATDNIDGDLTSSIVVGGDIVNTSAVGVYVITYNVSDAAGNQAAEVTRTVTVNPDTIAPVIVLNGASTINLNIGDTYTEQGATATDNVDGNLTSSIVISGTVNTASAGTYFVNYNVSDSSGNAANQVTRTIIVSADTTAPVIVLNGASTINLNIGDTYTEQGATATDNVDGDLTSNIVISGTVNTASAGTYFVNYNVSDFSGNAANQVTRTVIVSADTIAPVITLNGASTINLNVGDTYTEQGATATDNIDGDLTSSIVIAGTVNTAIAGSYSVTYNVSDAAGNAATEVVRTVNVTTVQLNYCDSASTNINDEFIGRVQLNTIDNASGGQFYTDFTSISTTLTKDTQYTITVTPTWTGTVYSEGYSVWIDYNRDGDFGDAGEQVWTQSATQSTPVSGSFTIPSSAVENSTRMRVSMKYNGIPTSCETFQYGEVEDYTVIIEGAGPDTTAPVITLNGASTLNLNVGDSYTELGANATDNVDGDISSAIVIGGDTVDTNSVGTYVVTYNVSDAAGNAAAEVTRTVNVNPDTTPPVITLNGASTINLIVGDTYTELGATAIDNLDGDISGDIVIGGDTVDANTVGAYVITYNVSDAAGNNAVEVTRTVNVNEPSTGCSGGISSFPYSEGFENTLGAWTQSTSDDIDWTVDANGTPSSNTGPSSASQGTYYVFVEASSPNYPSRRAILNSPCFDLSGMSTPEFSFDYHMYGAADMGTIDLEVSTDDGANWTSIWNESGNKGNTWLSASVDLSAYAGGSVQLRFNRFVGSTWQADIAIDNINLSEPVAPTCNDGIQNGNETGVDCGGSCAPCSTSNVTLHEGYFETGWDGWIDGGSDAARYSGANSYEGSYSIRLRDNSNSSTMTLSNVDVTPYSQVIVDFYFYVSSMENGEDFWLQFYNGSSYVTAQSWVAGTDINNNSFYNATVTLTPAQYNFAANSGFRFRCDASNNSDFIYIDQVIITGTTTGRGDINNLIEVGTLNSEVAFEGDFKFYPNPVKGNILNVELLEGDEFSYKIINMIGQTVRSGNSEGQVNVSQLEAGMYFIEINDGEEIMTKKFIKQ